MTNEQLTTTPAKRRRGGAFILAGILALLAGIAVAGAAFAIPAMTTSEVGGFLMVTKATPASITTDLGASKSYAVFQAIAADAPTVEVADVAVTGPDGAPVAVAASTANTSIGTIDNGKKLLEVATFATGLAGSYAVTVAAQGAVVNVAPSAASIESGLGMNNLFPVGGGLALLGIVSLVVGVVRRRGSR